MVMQQEVIVSRSICLILTADIYELWLFLFSSRVWDRRRTMLVAKRQVIHEGPWAGTERHSHPTRSSQDELDFF